MHFVFTPSDSAETAPDTTAATETGQKEKKNTKLKSNPKNSRVETSRTGEKPTKPHQSSARNRRPSQLRSVTTHRKKQLKENQEAVVFVLFLSTLRVSNPSEYDFLFSAAGGRNRIGTVVVHPEAQNRNDCQRVSDREKASPFSYLLP